MTLPLADLEVLALDCQATGASPGGQLLEVGWARSSAAGWDAPEVESHVVAPPGPVRLPRRVRELTGLTPRELKGAPSSDRVGARLAEVVREAAGSAAWAGVAHFARFEEPYLRALLSSGRRPPVRAPLHPRAGASPAAGAPATGAAGGGGLSRTRGPRAETGPAPRVRHAPHLAGPRAAPGGAGRPGPRSRSASGWRRPLRVASRAAIRWRRGSAWTCPTSPGSTGSSAPTAACSTWARPRRCASASTRTSRRRAATRTARSRCSPRPGRWTSPPPGPHSRRRSWSPTRSSGSARRTTWRCRRRTGVSATGRGRCAAWPSVPTSATPSDRSRSRGRVPRCRRCSSSSTAAAVRDSGAAVGHRAGRPAAVRPPSRVLSGGARALRAPPRSVVEARLLRSRRCAPCGRRLERRRPPLGPASPPARDDDGPPPGSERWSAEGVAGVARGGRPARGPRPCAGPGGCARSASAPWPGHRATRRRRGGASS